MKLWQKDKTSLAAVEKFTVGNESFPTSMGKLAGKTFETMNEYAKYMSCA